MIIEQTTKPIKPATIIRTPITGINSKNTEQIETIMQIIIHFHNFIQLADNVGSTEAVTYACVLNSKYVPYNPTIAATKLMPEYQSGTSVPNAIVSIKPTTNTGICYKPAIL